MMLFRAAILLFALLGWVASASAHEVRPGYLEARQIDGGTYDVLWKVPARGEQRLSLHVVWPGNCRATDPAAQFTDSAFVERMRVSCTGGLVGGRILIDGLDATRTDVLARVERTDGTTQTVRLTPAAPGFTVVATAGALEVANTYFVLGVEHILAGIDHLLFVLGLLFLVRSWGRLVGTVTAFTVAHSLTLAAATLGLVYVPQKPVEAAIALSIVFVAADILRAQGGRASLTLCAPWIVAFVFGLLHGFGFAGALSDVGLPAHAVPLALLFFNVGVEAGQILFIAAVFALLWLLKIWRVCTKIVPGDSNTWNVASSVSRTSAYVIGTLAAFWVFERVAGFWV